jgi:hypothetical protein
MIYHSGTSWLHYKTEVEVGDAIEYPYEDNVEYAAKAKRQDWKWMMCIRHAVALYHIDREVWREVSVKYLNLSRLY